MRKIFCICCLLSLCACAEHDPILPGVRTPIFDTQSTKILNTNIENLPDNIPATEEADCPYTQDSSNVIRDGDRKIFSGFPTKNAVASNQTPICKSGYVYAGLTTGEVVKVAPKSKKIMWIADVFKTSNMTGGASIVDIIAPLVINGDSVYAGGMGEAFCRIDMISGVKKWCIEIGTAVPFIVSDNVSFVVGTDNYLYAIRNSDGAIYWRTQVEKQTTPMYENKVISIGKLNVDASTGELIKE